MRAIVQHEYGPARNVLRPDEIDPPVIGEAEVLVRVHAAGVNAADWHLVRGDPYVVRLMVFGLRRPKSPVPGMDVAGTVEAVGAEVAELQPGDHVFGTCTGAFAEYARASADSLVRKPEGLTFEQAATVPISGCTALQGLRDRGCVEPGQSVLVNGASGGVGTFAVQIAGLLGAEVTGVCSTRNLDLVRSLGAAQVIDYTREDFARAGRRWDVILDAVGNRSLSDCRRALTTGGTLVLVGGEGGRWLGGLDRSLRAVLWSPFVRERLRMLLAIPTKSDLLALGKMIGAGDVTPVIDRTYPLSETPDAIGYVEEGHARGKVVVVAANRSGSPTTTGRTSSPR